MYPCTLITLCTFFGILGYSIHSNGGEVGSLVKSTIHLSNSQRAFRMVQCVSSIGGTWAATAERISDWTRFSKSRNAPNFAFFIAMPLGVTFSALLGVLTASATLHLTGQVQWNPLVLLQTWQAQSYTPACRAGTFFAGLALFFSQIYVNMANNTVGAGMDIAGLQPKYLSMRRAAMMMVILSILIQPWRFLSQAYIFIQVLSIASSKLSVTY
jgi:nucleobase:cation symporter-1, NCS1 family